MRYTINRSGTVGESAHQRETLPDAVWLALTFMDDGTPGLTTSITDDVTK